jgi:hypothetical protein
MPEERENTEAVLRSLAVELARDIDYDIDVTLKRHGLTREEYDELAETRQFKTMLAQAIKEWSAASNTGERVKIKSAALVEEALPHMFAELTNKEHPLSSRADLFGRIARIGNLGNPIAAASNSGEAFSITINLGAGKKPVLIQQDLLPRVTADDNAPGDFGDAWEDL